jgi:hypothetical protein
VSPVRDGANRRWVMSSTTPVSGVSSNLWRVHLPRLTGQITSRAVCSVSPVSPGFAVSGLQIGLRNSHLICGSCVPFDPLHGCCPAAESMPQRGGRRVSRMIRRRTNPDRKDRPPGWDWKRRGEERPLRSRAGALGQQGTPIAPGYRCTVSVTGLRSCCATHIASGSGGLRRGRRGPPALPEM